MAQKKNSLRVVVKTILFRSAELKNETEYNAELNEV